jgi:hypothetical protein
MVFQQGYLVGVSAQCGATDYTFTLVRQHSGAHFHALVMTPMQESIFLPAAGI